MGSHARLKYASMSFCNERHVEQGHRGDVELPITCAITQPPQPPEQRRRGVHALLVLMYVHLLLPRDPPLLPKVDQIFGIIPPHRVEGHDCHCGLSYLSTVQHCSQVAQDYEVVQLRPLLPPDMAQAHNLKVVQIVRRQTLGASAEVCGRDACRGSCSTYQVNTSASSPLAFL